MTRQDFCVGWIWWSRPFIVIELCLALIRGVYRCQMARIPPETQPWSCPFSIEFELEARIRCPRTIRQCKKRLKKQQNGIFWQTIEISSLLTRSEINSIANLFSPPARKACSVKISTCRVWNYSPCTDAPCSLTAVFAICNSIFQFSTDMTPRALKRTESSDTTTCQSQHPPKRKRCIIWSWISNHGQINEASYQERPVDLNMG